MSNGAYSPDKALAHPERLKALREGRQPYPVHLHLIISDLCNLDCPTCSYRWSGYSSNQMFGVMGADGAVNHNPNRMLSPETVYGILDDCVKMGVRAVEFTGGGEPTIHPHAPAFLSRAQRLGLDTALITNGIKLYRMGDAAVRTKWLRISLDAATPETYAKVRPGVGGPRPQNFHTAVGQIQDAVHRRNDLGTDCTIGVGFVVQKDNWREIYEAARFYKSIGVDNVRFSGVFSPEGDAYHETYRNEAILLEKKAVAELDDGKFRVYGRFHEKLADLAGPPTVKTCWYQHFTTYIGGDGNLYRCCVTSYNAHGLIGNVIEAGGFKALWDSRLKEQLFEHFDARSCTRCQFNDRLRAIEAAVTAEEIPPCPPDTIHKTFV